MRNAIACLILLIAFCAHAAPRITLPETRFSSLQYKTDEHGYLEFEGQIWITGTLIGRWITPPEESVATYLELTIIPDPIMATRMPSYEGYETTVIFLSHESSALKLGFKPRAASALLTRKVLRIEQRGEFLLSNFAVSIDCDNQSASAKLVQIKPETAKIYLVEAHACGYSDHVGG